MGINVDDLLEESNWDGDIFKLGDRTWNFEFKYDGSVMTEQIKEEE